MVNLRAIQVAADLALVRPVFHVAGAAYWRAKRQTLELIARNVRPADRTVETGCGASTVVFAATGALHTAISPSRDEYMRVLAYCAEHAIDASGVTFVEGYSDQVLPSLGDDQDLDFAFIDGAHAFPYPILDWSYLARRVRLGGFLTLDDVPIPTIAVAYRFMRADEAWELVEIADDQAASFRRVAHDLLGDYWRIQRFNRSYPDFSFLPVSRRVPLTIRQRLANAKRWVRSGGRMQPIAGIEKARGPRKPPQRD